MYEIFEQLMKSYGYTAYKVSVETGIAQSTLSDWKKGKSTPKADKMQKIADLFNVSVDYLMTGEEKDDSIPYYLNDDARDMAQFMFENPEYKVLFDASRKVSKDDIKTVAAILDKFKNTEM